MEFTHELDELETIMLTQLSVIAFACRNLEVRLLSHPIGLTGSLLPDRRREVLRERVQRHRRDMERLLYPPRRSCGACGSRTRD